MITVSGLTKSYGGRILFRDVTLQVSAAGGSRSSAATASARPRSSRSSGDVQQADDGEVHRPKDLTHRLPAPGAHRTGRTARCSTRCSGAAHVQRPGAAAGPARRRPGRTDERTADATTRRSAAYGEAQHRFETLGGYAIEAEAQRVLAGLGLRAGRRDSARRRTCRADGGCGSRSPACCWPSPTCWSSTSRPTTSTSKSVAWLETAPVSRGAGAMLFVSHDRDFIDAVAERVIELAAGRRRSTSAASPSSSCSGRTGSPGCGRRRPRSSARSPTSSGSSSASATRPPRPARSRAGSRRWTEARRDRGARPPDAQVPASASRKPQRSSRVVVEPSDVDRRLRRRRRPLRRRPGRSSGARRWR